MKNIIQIALGVVLGQTLWGCALVIVPVLFLAAAWSLKVTSPDGS